MHYSKVQCLWYSSVLSAVDGSVFSVVSTVVCGGVVCTHVQYIAEQYVTV